MTFAVVACPYCKKAKTFELGRKSTTCAHCSRTLKLEHLGVFHQTESLEEAQLAAGELNARYGGLGATAEFRKALAEANPEPPMPDPDDPWAPVHRAARTESSEVGRADAVARALTAVEGEWTQEKLTEAFERVGLKPGKAEAHLKRMLDTSVIYEPRAGRYRSLNS
ncbi:MAG TPA: hypothetical protein VNZ52_02145 [Candidatus Thermoplasmatota archaeon]|nr:hypothetical protein [Candidatus Thermoplasmatota archaeon]